ncbi:MAG: LPS-assembly protein LptD [Acidobacteriota bacterium]
MLWVRRCALLTFVWMVLGLPTLLHAQQKASAELPSPRGIVKIEANQLRRVAPDTWIAEGDVVVQLQDIVLNADYIEYDPTTRQASARGHVRFTRGVEWARGSRVDINLETQQGTFYEADGFTDREFYFKGRVVVREGPDRYRVRSAFITACLEDVPKWSFTARKATIKVDRSATLWHSLFRIKNIPVFYTPYLRVPLERKRRSSGILLPTTGTSTNKGRRYSQEIYLTRGQSADTTLGVDYYRLRGPGYRMQFRATPNLATRLQLDSFFIKDKLGQGGASVAADAETRFGDWRGVAPLNLVTNFTFRQVFSDTFRSATIPNETSSVFLTNNRAGLSTTIGFHREETFFPFRSIIVRTAPALSFRILGKKARRVPLYFSLDTAADGLHRVDRFLDTAEFVQRLDVFPRFYMPLRLPFGSTLTTGLGVRETFYSDSLDPLSRRPTGAAIHRQYAEFTLDWRGFGFSRIFRRADGTPWFKHLVETEVTYRTLKGIDDFHRVLRFDDKDAIANSHEVEYSLVQRFFVRQALSDGSSTNHEMLSFRLSQKYFLDPFFGGALVQGSANQFYPLSTTTGFLYGGFPRRFAPVTGLVRFSPSRALSADLRADYDMRFNRFRNLSFTGSWFAKSFFVSTTYYLTQRLELGTDDNHQMQALIGFGDPNRGFSGTAAYAADLLRSKFLNSGARVNYYWDCCGVSLDFQQFDLGVRKESQLRFSFALKGIGAFGTIQRPREIF